MGTKHRHCEAIKAWADGAIIEYSDDDGKTWLPCDNPAWYENLEYRIKPKKVKRYARMYLTPDGVEVVAVAEDIDPRITQSIRDMGSKEPYPWIGEWVPYEVEVEQ